MSPLGVPSGRAAYAFRPWIVVTVPDGVPSLTEPVRQPEQEIPGILIILLPLNVS